MTDTATQTTPRRRSMFFEKVGQKDPPFGKTLFLYKVVGGKDYFTTGKLISKTETESGFEYRFSDDQNDTADSNVFDYYLLPQIN